MAEKTEKKSGGGQIIKLALVLFAVSAIMALALGLVYEVTKDTISMRAAETTKNAYANVLQADDYAEQADFENDGTITKLSVATTGGEQTGYVAETTFFLAIPVMAGASLLKVVKFVLSGAAMTGTEVAVLVVGCVVAFVVSLAAIRFLMDYVKRHNFKFFGLYRIVLGAIVLAVAAITAIA